MTRATVVMVGNEISGVEDLRQQFGALGYLVPPAISWDDEAPQRIGELCPDLLLVPLALAGVAAGLAASLKVPTIYVAGETPAEQPARKPFEVITPPFEPRALDLAIQTTLWYHRLGSGQPEADMPGEAEHRLRQILAQVPFPIEVCSPDGTATMVNQAFLDMFGIPSAERVVGKYNVFADRLVMEELGLGEAIRRVYGGEMVTLPELAFPRSRIPAEYGVDDPAPVLQAITMFPVFRPSGEIWRVVTTWQDITHHKATENELRHKMCQLESLRQQAQAAYDDLKRAQAQLVQSAKMAAIGELAAGIAHELNNPLTSVLGYAELLSWNTPPGDQAAADVAVILEEARRARDIVRDLLDFARQRESQFEVMQLDDLLRHTVSLVRHYVQKGGVLIEEDYAPNLPPVRLDRGRMQQVMLNLLTNAVQAMPAGGRLSVRIARQGDELLASIADTGHGIPAHLLGRIFEPFFTTRSVGEGPGLGLAVSLGIVQEHGGRIDVESQDGQGSTFTVWLPVLRDLEGGGR